MYNVLVTPGVAHKILQFLYMQTAILYIGKHETFTLNSKLEDAHLGRLPAWYITRARSPTVQLGANMEK